MTVIGENRMACWANGRVPEAFNFTVITASVLCHRYLFLALVLPFNFHNRINESIVHDRAKVIFRLLNIGCILSLLPHIFIS